MFFFFSFFLLLEICEAMMFSSEVFSFINVSNTFVDFMKNGLHEEYHFSRF